MVGVKRTTPWRLSFEWISEQIVFNGLFIAIPWAFWFWVPSRGLTFAEITISKIGDTATLIVFWALYGLFALVIYLDDD